MPKLLHINIILFLLLLSSMAWSASGVLTVTASTGGSVSPTSKVVDSGKKLNITATPDNSYRFVSWTISSGRENCSIADNSSESTTITVNGDCTIRANFRRTRVLTVAADLGGWVWVWVSPTSKVSDTGGLSTSKVVDTGGTWNITAMPSFYYRFTGWTIESGGCTLKDASATSTSVIVNTDCTVKANFVDIRELTLVAGTGGSVSSHFIADQWYVDEPGVERADDLHATPIAGYRFDKWTITSGNSNCRIPDDYIEKPHSYIFLTGSCTVKASFVKLGTVTWKISSTSGRGGSIYVTEKTTPTRISFGGPSRFDIGQKLEITAEPSEQQVFKSWTTSTNCPVDDDRSATTYVTVNGDCTIKANFADIVELKLTPWSQYQGETNFTSKTVVEGSTVDISASAKDGYFFYKWKYASSRCIVADQYSSHTKVTVHGNCKLEAIFLKTFTFAIGQNIAEAGTTSPYGYQTVHQESHNPISATPNSGYRFDRWVPDVDAFCIISKTTSTSTSVQVYDNCSVTAYFVKTQQLMVSASMGGSVSSAGTKTVDYGSDNTITATPNSGYRFDKWTSDNASCVIADTASDSTTVSISADCNITAKFVKIQYIDVYAGRGGASSPSTHMPIDSGAILQITATPDSSYRFGKWTSTSASCIIVDAMSASTSVKVSDDCSVKAIFVATKTFSVSANIDAGGTTSPDGEQTVDAGSFNPISATPNSGYRFDRWKSNYWLCVIADTASDSTTVIVSDNCNITANFVKIQQLTVSSSTGGSVSSAGTKTVDYGSDNTITATPDSGYRFDKWTSDKASCVISDTTKASTSVEVSDDCNVEAIFVKLRTFSVSANIDAGGTVSPDKDLTVDEGSSNPISATPSSGYRFDKWTSSSKSCVISKATSMSTSVKVSDDCKITANFVKTQNVTIASSTGGYVKSSGSKTVDIDTKINLRAVEDTGYVFEKWISTSKKCIVADPASLSTSVRVADDCSVTANFVKVEYVFLEEDFVRDMDSVETTEVDFAFSLNTASPTNDKADTIMVALFTDQGDTLWVPAYETDVHSGEYEGRSSFRFVTSPEDQKDDVLDAVMDLDADVNRAVIRMQIGKDNSALDSRDSIVVFYGFIPADSAEILDQDQDGQADLVRVHFAKSILHEQLKIDTLFWGGAEDDGRGVADRNMEISDDGDWIYASLESPFEYGVTAVDSTGKKFVKISRNTSSAIQKVTLSDKVGPVPIRAEKCPGVIRDKEYLNGKVDLPPDTLVVTLSEPIKILGGAKAFGKKRSVWSNMFQYAESCDNGKVHPVSLEQSPKLDKSGKVWTMLIPHEIDIHVGQCLMTNPEAPFEDAAGNAPAIGGVSIEGDDGDIYIYSFKAAPAVARDTISAIKVDARLSYKAKVTIFSNFGHVVAQFSRKNDEGLNLIEWNQRATDNRLVGTGVYIWRIQFKFADGHKETRFIRTGIKR